jgi:carbon storage regulator CsrA
MLVLSRKSCQSVVVGDPAGSIKQMLTVTVLEIRTDQVKLGFEVAGDVSVNRWEVWNDLHSRIRPNPGIQAVEEQKVIPNIL